MKDGSVVCSFEDGQITDIALKADLDHIYGRMFSSARVAALKNPDKKKMELERLFSALFG